MFISIVFPFFFSFFSYFFCISEWMMPVGGFFSRVFIFNGFRAFSGST